MTTTADLAKLVSYAVLNENGPLASKIVSYAVLATPPAPFRQTDWPNPRGAVPAITQRSWSDSYKLLLLVGQDRFFGAPGQAPANLDWPVPNGAVPNSTLRTWLDPSTIQLSTLPVAPPFFQTDWPNPRGPLPGTITQRSWSNSYKLPLVGQDQFFANPGQAPANLDWPVPKGAVPNSTLRTWLNPSTIQLSTLIVTLPFRQTDWPNPRGPLPGTITQRSWLNPSTIQLSTLPIAPPFFQTNWPNPQRPDIGRVLRTWADFVNLIAAGIPSYVVNAKTTMAMEWVATQLRDPVVVLETLLTPKPIRIRPDGPLPSPTKVLEDPLWVAVEFDLVDLDGNPVMLRLSNRGTLTRVVAGQLYEYDPRLTNLPIQLGTSITVTGSISITQYGSPTRSHPNGGSIDFDLDELIWKYLQYHWLGHKFRVYEGENANPARADVDADLTLVYVGRIADITHDSKIASIQTTDETIQWDNPLITDFYDANYPVAIQGKPKPYLWGYGFSLKPEIEDEANQIWGVSHRPGGLDFITEVRVGGIPWNLNVTGPPGQGEWTPNLANGTFQLGSPPLSFDVRCDAQQGNFQLSGVIRDIITTAGGEVDDESMAALDVALPARVSFATTTSPVNRLTAIDDFSTSAGCWWGVNALGKVVAGVIDIPAPTASLLLGKNEINSVSHSSMQAPAWRIRVGYQRNWEPQTNFAPSVLQTQQARWSATSRVFEPHFDNNPVLASEPRAVDVPLLDGTFLSKTDAAGVQHRLVRAWGTRRSLFDVTAFLRPEDIKLYDTVALDYMMVTGNFRVTSAIRAIGGGPATLQLWGTIGPLAVELTLPTGPTGPIPGDIIDMGIWVRKSGSGAFQIGTDAPSTVTRLWYRGIAGGGGGAGRIESLGFANNGGGGGCGGYFEDVIKVTAGDVFDWAVGTGGLGQGFGISGLASNGADTNFGTAIGFGGGGGAATPSTTDGGAGGGASGATLLIQGSGGSPGGRQALPEVSLLFEGNGAASPFGAGGRCTTTLEGATGAPGSGGGGHTGPNPAPGNPGHDGLIIVIWFQD